MKTSSARRLLELNRRFYDAFAGEFADSRRALQPGIVRALRALGEFDSLIDVGCGDGRVGRCLLEGIVARRPKRYLGVDFSPVLAGLFVPTAQFEIAVADLSQREWSIGLGRFDAAVCFSALHHIPGSGRRLHLLREVRSLLKSGGRCAISVWQVMHVERLRKKIVPWSEIGLSQADVDAGDYLIDWQRGGRGLRYVHEFDEAELVGLCRRAGLDAIEVYRSDGATGNMGLYAITELGSDYTQLNCSPSASARTAREDAGLEHL